MNEYTYITPEENEDKVVIFTIGEKQMIMSEIEYNKHIEEGRTNPVLVGETLHMVSNEDFEIIKKMEGITGNPYYLDNNGNEYYNDGI